MSAERWRILPKDELDTALDVRLPRWSVHEGHLARTYRTAGWKGTLMVVNAIGHLAEVAFHHPDLTVVFDRVEVRLISHDAGGITSRDVALAEKIEEVVLWRPGADPASPLDGPPDDPRFIYLVYD